MRKPKIIPKIYRQTNSSFRKGRVHNRSSRTGSDTASLFYVSPNRDTNMFFRQDLTKQSTKFVGTTYINEVSYYSLRSCLYSARTALKRSVYFKELNIFLMSSALLKSLIQSFPKKRKSKINNYGQKQISR